MDVLDEYGGLVNGEPLRIKPEDIECLIRLVSSLSYVSSVNMVNNPGDVIEISRVVNQLVSNHNHVVGTQVQLSITLRKILDYNKK